MSGFSVSYSGLADAELHLHEVYIAVNNVSAKLYTIANKTGGVRSLENKGYVKTIRAHGLHAYDIGEQIRKQGRSLQTIGSTYSGTERRILGHLSELSSVEAGFSKSSGAIARRAIEGHERFKRRSNVGREIEDTSTYREIRAKVIQEARYWRSTKGRKLVEKCLKGLFGDKAMDNPIIQAVIETANGAVEYFEDITNGFLNITNPDAVKKSLEAVGGILGLSGFINMAPRYLKMTDAFSRRAGKIAKSGHPIKALVYTAAAGALETAQVIGDLAYNASTFALNIIAKKRKSSKASKASEGIGVIDSTLRQGMTAFGDWCWSGLDSAFGL